MAFSQQSYQGQGIQRQTEVSQIGQLMGAGVAQAGNAVGQGIQAYNRNKAQAKAFRNFYNTWVKGSADIAMSNPDADKESIKDTMNQALARGEEMGLSELKGWKDGLAVTEAKRQYEEKMRLQNRQDQRAQNADVRAERADVRAEEAHDATLASAPDQQENLKATTRLKNAQSDTLEAQLAADAAQLEAVLSGKMLPEEQTKQVVDTFKAIRSEPSVRKFDEAESLLASLRENVKASDRSAPMDIALVFSFMRALDPGSTVREGEFATAKTAGSIPTAIYNAYNQALKGNFLTPEQVKQFLQAAEKSVSGFAGTANKVRKQHLSQLDKLGADSSLVAIDEFEVGSSTPQSFGSIEEAESAGLKPGDRVVIGGVPGVLQ